MAETLPTFENVFSDSYWQPVPPMLQFRANGSIRRYLELGRTFGFPTGAFDKHTKELIDSSLLFAVNSILTGGSLTRIERGEQIGGPNDSKYALAGAVILVDKETVTLGPPYEKMYAYEQTIEDEAELQRGAITAWLGNMTWTRFGTPYSEVVSDTPLSKLAAKIIDSLNRPSDQLNTEQSLPRNYEILNTYNKHLLDTQKGVYTRDIRLCAFSLNKSGQLASVSSRQWFNNPGGPSISHTYSQGLWPKAAVGETVNISTHEDRPWYARIREAVICLYGVAAPAKEKQGFKARLLASRPASASK